MAYAATFSVAYMGLTAGTGALLLFGAVQVVMIAAGYRAGERINRKVAAGWLAAVGGIAALTLPSVSSPPLSASLLMIAAGIAWGLYSLRGRRSSEPIAETAGNFVRAVPIALILNALMFSKVLCTGRGVLLAVVYPEHLRPLGLRSLVYGTPTDESDDCGQSAALRAGHRRVVWRLHIQRGNYLSSSVHSHFCLGRSLCCHSRAKSVKLVRRANSMLGGEKSVDLQPQHKFVHEQIACGVLLQRSKSVCAVLIVVQLDLPAGLRPLFDDREARCPTH